MKKFYSIFFGLLIMCCFGNSSFAREHALMQQAKDTAIVPATKEEDRVIEEVIESKAPVKKEKVEYLSQVTKYGFKNLFSNYSYNAAMPYSSQVNPHAENYMQSYLQSHTKYLQNLKRTSMPYFNFIDGILAQYGLPKELKYLAVIESNLKSSALSSAGARGPWQFMSYTAKDYGLQVNQMVDDRTDYFKSTNAAAKYLLNLYKDLKDWLLVIAAYNGGPGRVYSAIKKSGSRNFWNLQYYLPEESRNHVKKFIATHYILGFLLIQLHRRTRIFRQRKNKIWGQCRFQADTKRRSSHRILIWKPKILIALIPDLTTRSQPELPIIYSCPMIR